ncbi:sigma-70 family RNA polymerase sigma factor [Rugosimonospora africana]|uniref:RNA polymerase sigma factor n=1 Tax=Rugosimonospora africana TaxID=556532 RepID=A0A8J3QVR0_9ACTN|nr:sigma-70 family RNA polymerase sigma factor [Rugosimonospora africana]GIH17974.1 RNA polymerase sigma factor [Rugosimonospora africana]
MITASVPAAGAPASTAADASDASDPAAPPSSADERMRALYRAHAGPLYRFLLRITFGDAHAAEDLMQETLLRAWRNLDGLNPDVDSVRPWLFTVGRRIAIDAARARNVRPTEVHTADAATLPTTEDAIERLVNVQAVREAMVTLNPDHRSVLIELYYRERSTAEAAQRLGIPVGTVKSRTHYALRSLSAAIGAALA